MPVVNPGIRRQVAGAITRLFNSAAFALPLTHTAVPTRAASGTTGTFTRATTATWTNNDGYMVTGVAGEIGFPGARRVRNWIQAPTENWSGAGWTKSGISVSGNRLTATGANGVIYNSAALGMGTGRTAVGSVTLSRVTGTGNIDVSINGGTTWTTVNVTGARVSVSLTGNINGQFAIRIVTSGDSVDATYPQLEDVTAQTTQTAGEYVSVGVESAPYYHGSMVDGVKCFATDLSGNPIAASINTGYLAEGARTNHFLQSGTPATQTSGLLSTGTYTLWMDGTGSIAVAGATATITGAGTATSTTAVTFTVTVAGTVTYTVTGSPTRAQSENGAFRSSYIATTTVAVTGNADVESVSTSNNIAAAAGSVYLEYTPTHTPSGTIALWGTYVDASNYTAILHDATNLIFRKRIAGVNYDATIANAFVSGTTYKACATWGTAGTSITLNGTEGTPHANTTAAQIAATMQWGADGNSLQQPFASIRNCRDWLRQLSASERAAVTA